MRRGRSSSACADELRFVPAFPQEIGCPDSEIDGRQLAETVTELHRIRALQRFAQNGEGIVTHGEIVRPRTPSQFSFEVVWELADLECTHGMIVT